jgi:hypothetical protein
MIEPTIPHDRVIDIKAVAGGASGRPHSLERFRREALAASALNHSNICAIYEVGADKTRQIGFVGRLRLERNTTGK